MIDTSQTARLTMLQAAYVVARRDFTAILFSRSFLFFLLGPLFPAIVMGIAVGLSSVQSETKILPAIAVQMEENDTVRLERAREKMAEQLGDRSVPKIDRLALASDGGPADPTTVLKDTRGKYGAVLTGTLKAPILTATPDRLRAWQGLVAMQLALTQSGGTVAYPDLTTQETESSGLKTKDQRKNTATISMTVLFMLMMMLAGMVLSNLVEEKANKIIEILAAALPMDAVFLGKLFAMLAISLVGIAVWFSLAGLFYYLGGDVGGYREMVDNMPEPGVGWPMFAFLFVVNFSMGYLLIGSIFLTIGALASTVREVQTLSMPVTMMQLFIFVFASFALVGASIWVELATIAFPLSSPFAMTARAAQSELLWPHLAAFIYQAIWVLIFIRFGAKLFRSRVMKSGAGGGSNKRSVWQRLLKRAPAS
ncbi:MAG: ABC transporter permease [Marinomonas sp.]